jgi:hypothetical protein
MRTCPVCGRQYADDVTVCPQDGEPLGAVTVTGPRATDDVDEETVVRPKRAQPLAQPRFTEIRIGASGPASVATGAATSVPIRVARERPMWPLVSALSALVVIGIGMAIYFAMAGQTDLAKEVGTQITDARVAVADARARLESLPMDSPLRNKLLSLQQWDRELQNLELGHDRSREVAARAREIANLARSIGEEARIAGATIPASPPVVQPAAPPPAPAGTETGIDPMAPKQAETPAPGTTENENKTATPPAVTPPTAPPADTKTPAVTNQSAPVGKEPDGKAPPTLPPPGPPPSPEQKKPGAP